MAYEKETGNKPNGNIIFYGIIVLFVALAVWLDRTFGIQYDENGKEIKKDKDVK